MSYVALYREWRPKIFEDVIGQEHIVKIIKNQLLQERIPHAYLLCGTRGTGKTTTAKILSRAVNCINPIGGDPCNQCEACRGIMDGTLMDVIEIDAASNNRVENIRELIDDVKYPPHNTKYKVYIIDEVHMLSTSAFNALLKTLEEPPRHVVFILATTDPQKVPATILSRCQRFDFKRIKSKDISSRLRQIVDENGTLADDKTLELIARVSDGAMRDAVSILDQCMSISKGKIEYEDVAAMLGIVASDSMFRLVDAMIDGDIEASIQVIDEIILNGKDVLQFIKDLTKHFRNLLMVKVSKKPGDIIDVSEDTINRFKEQAKRLRSEEIMRGINIIIDAENDSKYTSQPRILLEMAAVKFCKKEYDSSLEMMLGRIKMLEEAVRSGAIAVSLDESKPKKEAREVVSKPAPPMLVKETRTQQVESEAVDKSADSISIDEVKTCWQEVIGLIKSNKKVTVSAWLSLGVPVNIDGNNIIISFDHQHVFSKNNLENPPENKRIVEECFSRILNKPARVTFRVNEEQSTIDRDIERVRSIVGDDLIEVIE